MFLAVVVFVFVFVPGTLEPFTTGTQEETVETNRVADSVVHGTFGTPKKPEVLDRACTVWFFEHDGDGATPPSDCNYDGTTTQARLGVPDSQDVNVTVTGNVTVTDTGSEFLCWEGDDRRLVEGDGDGASDGSCDDGGADVLLTAGESPMVEEDDAVTAMRVASLTREDVTIVVEMW